VRAIITLIRNLIGTIVGETSRLHSESPWNGEDKAQACDIA